MRQRPLAIVIRIVGWNIKMHTDDEVLLDQFHITIEGEAHAEIFRHIHHPNLQLLNAFDDCAADAMDIFPFFAQGRIRVVVDHPIAGGRRGVHRHDARTVRLALIESLKRKLAVRQLTGRKLTGEHVHCKGQKREHTEQHNWEAPSGFHGIPLRSSYDCVV